jgi:KDO2-lipid IV(A) lauroyltransferase
MGVWLFRWLGRQPLHRIHALGRLLGRLAALFSARHRSITRDNLVTFARATGLTIDAAFERRVFAAQGEGMTELAFAWTAPVERVLAHVRADASWHVVEAAVARGKPIIFVSPHLGCYDVAGRFVAGRLPLTALYRPPKQAWLETLMQAGRVRGGGETASADGAGIRALLKALKSGRHIMILPDQAPAAEKGGEGVWAPFFGRPAFTMTLLPRLAAAVDAEVIFFFAERLANGAGYTVHCLPMPTRYAADKAEAAEQTNQMVEHLITMAPTQYLWGYNRYKRPAGAPDAPSGG